jgi:molybdopterin molybdotransferase
MISVKEAQARIISNFKQPKVISISIDMALGRRLAKTIHSDEILPVFDNSSVDGFALRATETSTASADHPIELNVIGDIPAGYILQTPIAENQSARIMTGAPIPNGADAVVMVEDTNSSQNNPGGKAPKTILIFKPISVGENIRRRGSDINRGQKILPGGAILRPQDIGVLAMLGIPTIEVYRKPRVAIISSGDELVPVGSKLEPGKIHDSNSYMISALVQRAGCDITYLGVASDNFDSVQDTLLKAVDSKPDLVISTAGVSMGAFDYIKNVVECAGSLNFWKVDMRPGKPLAFGAYQNIPFFGLPGNPVSSYVSFLVFVQPVLDFLGGGQISQIQKAKVILAENIDSDGRESYLRAIVTHKNGYSEARLTGHQGSSNLLSLVQANALLIIPSGVKSCPPGSEVEAWILEQ